MEKNEGSRSRGKRLVGLFKSTPDMTDAQIAELARRIRAEVMKAAQENQQPRPRRDAGVADDVPC